jgi:hypothetical protein
MEVESQHGGSNLQGRGGQLRERGGGARGERGDRKIEREIGMHKWEEKKIV